VIVLIGFMGAGKSTIGRLLAKRLGQPFLDSDLVIEQRAGLTVREIFDQQGEPAFRTLEHNVIADLLAGPQAVLALGGGAPMDERTRRLLVDARVVYLRVSYEEALQRVRSDRFRPLLHRPGLESVYTGRLAVYTSAADLVVDTEGRRAEAIVLEILQRLSDIGRAPEGTSSVLVSVSGGTYYAHIGAALSGRFADLLPELTGARQAMIVTGDDVQATAAAVARSLSAHGLAVRTTVMPDRQSAKTLSTVATIVEDFAEAALHRSDLVVAVGGEAVCDLAGFAAATYNRGMPLALVPTTLAAQADGAIGGKNGINLKHGHNLLGTFHQPVVVGCDTAACQPPGRPGFDAGLAELAKHALVTGDAALLDLLSTDALGLRSGDQGLLQRAVTRSVTLKADVVGRDEREQGDRVFLNYGHTFGHAIELIADGRGPADSSDGADGGAALSVGMMAAAHLARRLGLADASLVQRHRQLLTGLGLPVSGRLSVDSLREAWLRDKKYADGVRFVVLRAVGEPVAGVTADDRTLAAVFEDLAVQAD
jgi:shikimate kinase/3-dehydroquinate synthase